MAYSVYLAALSATAVKYALDILDPDTVNKAIKAIAVVLFTCGWLTDKLTWSKLVVTVFVSVTVSYSNKCYQRWYNPRHRPDSPSETILPLYDQRPVPDGTYI